MRILLFTGKGGVGKTSVAAATALASARAGKKTLIISTDPAHSLADAYDLPLSGEPTEIVAGLWGQQIDSQQRLEESWRQIQSYAVELLQWSGMSGIEAEELSVIPGIDELFSLADVKHHYSSGIYDVLVVDCAPTAETLRLLSLPEILSWYIEKIFPVERKIAKAVRPVLNRMRSLPPIASDSVFEAAARFYDRIDGIKAILTDPDVTSIRLVMNPEKMVIAEAQRTFAYLSLFGYAVDAVVVNRLLPDEVVDPYFDKWRVTQSEHMETIQKGFSPLPILRSRLFDQEMVGERLLLRLSEELYAGGDPNAVLHRGEVVKMRKDPDGHALMVKLPFTTKEDVDLSRSGDELFIKVGNLKRNVVLPQALQRAAVRGAAFEDDWLKILFEPKDLSANGVDDARH